MSHRFELQRLSLNECEAWDAPQHLRYVRKWRAIIDEIIELVDDADALRFLKGAPVTSRLSTLVLVPSLPLERPESETRRVN